MPDLYYKDGSKAKVNGRCYFNTAKKENIQEQCIFPSDDDFINTLEYNDTKGVDFRRMEVKVPKITYD